MCHYRMGLDEALDTRMDVAQALVKAANVRENHLLVSLVAAIHTPKAVLEAVEKAKPSKDSGGGFNAGLAKLARLRAGKSVEENEKLAQAIELRTRAAELLRIVKGKRDGARAV